MQIDFRRKVGTLILTLLFVFSATFAFGQIVTGSISGVVEDQQHAMVSGAKVTAQQDGTSYQRSTTTTETGLFTITGLPVGSYTVTIEASKFSKLKMNNVGVTVAKDSSLGVRTLTIGTTETVIVEGAAPLVESNTTQIATSFSSKKVADLPIGSGYDMLALFVPGIAPAGDQGFSNNNGADISSNGQRGRSNNFMIDGQS
ncbi:MAG: carboxypeptidase-like regulatory domain-containing protein, partial [Acidobacteriota bacterium]|nr:carboxypeptidase-like regulatory domain-containing protein [Acidobacteriota bacterium]